ncbi:11614_t:CDS:2 [Paraglomus brasilianum]|uniref:11614_t:CDS:1 n=1 Tax=Paraglomus brasilianum TaxID=144538 RepID=A0A9N8WI38_9GLOM|nr:11614_t:CDS:2 [Paraglomus brasilianum]
MYKFSAPNSPGLSPTLSARTTTSYAPSIRTIDIFDPVVVLSRADIRASIEAYEQLLSTAKIYRNQLIALSQATAGFGQALERMARCKGALEAGPGLQAAAGLHYLMSNHQQVLSDSFYKKFEIPLLENLDVHKSAIVANEESYDKTLVEMSKRIKETEAENLRIGRKKQRDLAQFRKALRDLTQQVEQMDQLKSEYYHQTLDHEQNNLNFILSKVATIVRAEVDIHERIYTKGLADPLLEAMTSQGSDPFCAHTTADESSEIFTVLPPVSIINNLTPEINNIADFSSEENVYAVRAHAHQSQLPTQQEDKNMVARDQLINGYNGVANNQSTSNSSIYAPNATASSIVLPTESDTLSTNQRFTQLKQQQLDYISEEAEFSRNNLENNSGVSNAPNNDSSETLEPMDLENDMTPKDNTTLSIIFEADSTASVEQSTSNQEITVEQ